MAQQTDQQPPPGTPVRVDVGFDEIEASLAEQKTADETQVKATEAATIEEARVKAAAAAAPPVNESAQVRALQEALRISEESRRQVLQAGTQPPPPPPAPRKTKEELAALMQSDPLAAVAYMQEETVRLVTENVERRVGSLLKGTESTAETLARQKYPMEFELFGPKIAEFVATLPEANRASLSTTAGWDDLIAWFRGRPGNFEQLSTKISEKKTTDAAATAQAAQAAAAGAHLRSDQRTPAPTGAGQLDATQKEIAKALNMSDADYIKWARVAP